MAQLSRSILVAALRRLEQELSESERQRGYTSASGTLMQLRQALLAVESGAGALLILGDA